MMLVGWTNCNSDDHVYKHDMVTWFSNHGRQLPGYYDNPAIFQPTNQSCSLVIWGSSQFIQIGMFVDMRSINMKLLIYYRTIQ